MAVNTFLRVLPDHIRPDNLPLTMKGILLAICFSQVVFANAQKTTVDISGLKPLVIACTPVKDQYMSGTCWSFSSTSLLESELLKKGKGEADLSEMFIARNSLVRKIRRHLQLKGGNFFTPGGQFHDAVLKEGAIPVELVRAVLTKQKLSKDHQASWRYYAGLN
mgnify:CR=1 FL=1